MKLCSFNKMKESTYVSMLVALIISRYFLMTSLTSFCEKHLSKFKKNVMIININYEEVKALQFTATTVKKYSGLLIKNKHTIKIIRNIYKIFKKIEIEYNKKTYEELKELSYNDGWHDDMLDYIIVDKNGVSLQSTETVPYYVQCVDDTYEIETTVDYSIIKSPSYEDIIKSPSYEDIINTPTTLNLAKFIEIFINLIGCDMLNKFDSKIDDIIPMIEKLNNDNNDSDEDSDEDIDEDIDEDSNEDSDEDSNEDSDEDSDEDIDEDSDEDIDEDIDEDEEDKDLDYYHKKYDILIKMKKN